MQKQVINRLAITKPIISDVSPYETPWYSSIPKVRASNTYHEWQTDALSAPADDNAHIEGDDTTATSITATLRQSASKPVRNGGKVQRLGHGVQNGR